MATTKEIKRLMVYCPFRLSGCQEQMKYCALGEHISQCNFAGVRCPNEGCDVITLRSAIDQHIETDCAHVLIVCDTCNEQISRRDIRNDTHKRTCKPKPHPCDFQNVGCDFQGTPAEIKEHIAQNQKEHDLMTARKAEEAVKNVTVAQQAISEIEQKVEVLQSFLDPLKLNGQTENIIQTLQKSIASLAEKITINESQLNEKTDLSDFRAYASKVGELQSVMSAQESRLSQVEQRPGASSSGGGVQAAIMTDSSAQKFRQLENSIGAYDVRFAENELRFRLLETASYDGWMIWKITNYQRRKNDAKDGRTLSLYSQPFFTAPFGYRMCARVYLNGDGMGKGTHMSLFFVIMRSEYDALLPWPFRQRVTICLIDQSGRKRHIRDSFRPDPTSTSFRKPVGEMNVASGSPMFALQTTVESDSFLKDDTIFIGVSVDKQDMEVMLF